MVRFWNSKIPRLWDSKADPSLILWSNVDLQLRGSDNVDMFTPQVLPSQGAKILIFVAEAGPMFR